MNTKVVLMSILAILCLALGYLVSFWFFIPAVIIMILNHRELFGKKD